MQLGYAESYARPGGNVTGVAILGAELDAKRLDLLHEAVPGAKSIAVLYPGFTAGRAASESALRALAAARGLELVIVAAAFPEDYPAAFEAMRAAGVQALVISAGPQFDRDAAVLAALAAAALLPTVCQWARMARAGCLVGYGPDATALRLRLAHQVTRVFRGVSPGELPIETPTRFEFAINARAARALGILIPPALLARADEVIE